MTKLGFSPSSVMDLYCDNKASIDISHNLVQCRNRSSLHQAESRRKDNSDSICEI